MKKTWWGFCLVAIVLAVTVRPELVEGRVRGSTGSPRTDINAPRTEGTKYNPQFGNALEKARAQHATKRRLDCVIRLSHPPTRQDLAELKSSGFKSRSVVDTIVTGSIQVRHAQKLIDLPLVVSIEGGGSGGRKKTQGMK